MYDLHNSLEDFPLVNPKPSVVLRAEDIVPSGKLSQKHPITT